MQGIGKEHAMTSSPGIHRHPEGWIDIDHYRRVAARERQEATRRALDRCAGALGKLVTIVVAATESLSPRSLAR
jgi:hypothetical protein